jgi:hypothetical protein
MKQVSENGGKPVHVDFNKYHPERVGGGRSDAFLLITAYIPQLIRGYFI